MGKVSRVSGLVPRPGSVCYCVETLIHDGHALWFILFSGLSVADEQDRMQQLWALKERLPKPNLENLK